MKRTVVASAIVSVGCVLALHGQSASQPRRILFDTFVPIAARILPGDQRLVVMSAQPGPDASYVEADAFVATLVRRNPIIFVGRIVETRPAFLRLFAGQKATEVPVAEANWIGSRIIVRVEWIIRSPDEAPLTTMQQLAFVDELQGTATINGASVETETRFFEPIEQGRRYLFAGRLNAGAFSSTGMWMEPADGGSMRARFRDPLRVNPPADPALSVPKSPFDEWTIADATYWLEKEVQRQSSPNAPN